jgi:hypothetical protein
LLFGKHVTKNIQLLRAQIAMTKDQKTELSFAQIAMTKDQKTELSLAQIAMTKDQKTKLSLARIGTVSFLSFYNGVPCYVYVRAILVSFLPVRCIGTRTIKVKMYS